MIVIISATVNTSKRAAEEILEREIIKIHETPSESSNEIEILKKQLQNERELHQQELKRQAEVFSKILENEKSKLMSKIKSGQHKLYTLQRSIQRKEEHIKNMKHLFDELKKKYVSDIDALNMLSREFEGMALNLFQNEIKNKSRSASGRRYSDEVKKFAVTLFYHSPKAYDYCRLVLCFSFFLFISLHDLLYIFLL